MTALFSLRPALPAAFLAIVLSLLLFPPSALAGGSGSEGPPGCSVIARAEPAGEEGRPPAAAQGLEAVVLSVRGLPKGHTLTNGDVAVAHMEKGRIPPGALRDPAEAVGRSISRSIGAGVPIQERMLRAEEEVERGRRVTIAVVGPGLRVTVPGETLTAARVGGRVKVVNLATKRTVEGRLVDSRTVLMDF